MKNRLFSFVLSFTVITVVATAINCGCAFAQMPSANQYAEQAITGHCDQSREEKAKAGSEECCLGCELELGALNPHHFDFRLRFHYSA